MNNTLLPRPFCGGEAAMQAPNMHRKTCVVCKECGASTGWGTVDTITSAWNRRSDAVPVVCGRWTSLTECSNEGVYCSVCHKKVWKADYAICTKINKIRSNYCPNCGAKMEATQ